MKALLGLILAAAVTACGADYTNVPEWADADCGLDSTTDEDYSEPVPEGVCVRVVVPTNAYVASSEFESCEMRDVGSKCLVLMPGESAIVYRPKIWLNRDPVDVFLDDLDESGACPVACE